MTPGNGIVNQIKLLVSRYPLRAYVCSVVTLSWLVLTALILNKLPPEPGLLVVNFAGLLGLAVLFTYWISGKDGVRKLFAGVFRWRIGVGYYLLAILVIPFLTLLVAAIVGTLHLTTENWISTFSSYLISLVSGFLIINLWEETGWSGFVQSRLMSRKGLLIGSLLTAPAFTAIHLPLLLQQPTLSEMALSFVVLFGLSFFFRYLIGTMLVDTNGSIFIVGLLHASFNASGNLPVVSGKFENIPALITLTVLVIIYRKTRGESALTGSVSDPHQESKKT